MERWDIYNAQGLKTGKTIPKGAVLAPHEYHLAVEVWVVSTEGRLLIQQRSLSCEHSPGVWSITAGRVQAGEDSRQGCLRELREEIGLHAAPSDLEHLRRIVRTDGSQHIWDVYCLRGQSFDLSSLTLQPEEVAQVLWISPEGFLSMLESGLIFSYPEIREILAQIYSVGD